MLNKKAQSIAEYAVFIGMMVAAIAMMQTYLKRGLQAKYADSSDYMVFSLADPKIWDATLEDGSQGLYPISTTPVAMDPSYQFELTDLESRKTQTVIADKVNYRMDKGGYVTREIIQQTKNAAHDYVKWDF